MKPERQPRNRTVAPQEEENRIAGRNPVMEALKSGTPLDTIYMSGKQGILGQIAQLAADQGIPVKIVSDARLSQMTRQTHQGVVADGACATYASIAEILEYAAEKGEKPLLLICDEIQDPHNLGAILRTAEAAGFHGIILPKRRSASLNATVAKTSAGAVSWVKVARVPNLVAAMEELKQNGIWFTEQMLPERIIRRQIFGMAQRLSSAQRETEWVDWCGNTATSCSVCRCTEKSIP